MHPCKSGWTTGGGGNICEKRGAFGAGPHAEAGWKRRTERTLAFLGFPASGAHPAPIADPVRESLLAPRELQHWPSLHDPATPVRQPAIDRKRVGSEFQQR